MAGREATVIARTDHAVRRDYARLAPYYDRLWARYVGVSIGRTLSQLELRGGERVLDIGCGTGVLLGALARRPIPLELRGLDLTPEMLARARSRLGRAADLALGSAAGLPYPDASFDVVVSTSVLHFLPEPAGHVLAEWARVLAPGGTLVVTDWRADHIGTQAYRLVLRLVGRHGRPLAASALAAALEACGLVVDPPMTFQVGGWGLVTVRARKPPGPSR